MPTSHQVRGVDLDSQYRCAHYRSSLDVIAIRTKCCDDYFACKECHDELAGHAIEPWAEHEWNRLVVLCGSCTAELSARQYLDCGNRCPACGAGFNPGCRNHHHYYFEHAHA